MRLSEKLERYRTDRPDEWTMDEFARQARQLEDALLDGALHKGKVEQLMKGDEKCQLDFEEHASDIGMDLSQDFFNQRGDANKYINDDTRLAFSIWCNAIASRGA